MKFFSCNRLFVEGLCLVFLSLPTFADVTTDASLGRSPQTFSAKDITIAPELGQQHGANLFHSFQKFDIASGQSVTFTGGDDIARVISRVTGGDVSQIEGLLRSTLSHADIYLINPAGITFGVDAKLDVPGSVYLSTASHIDLGQAARFDAAHPENSVLSSASPSAFGFLTQKPAAITINGSSLNATEGKTLSLSAGNIQLNNGRLQANSGRIELLGVVWADKVISAPLGILVDSKARLGSVRLEDASSLSVGKQGGGNIFIRSGEFVMSNSALIANSTQGADGGVISIQAESLLLKERSKIDSRALGTSHGGKIILIINGLAELSNSDIFTTSAASNDPQNPKMGNAGNIYLEADCLRLTNSSVSTTSYDTGQGGDITLKVAKNLELLSNPNEILSPATSIQASSEGTNSNAGNAGRISISARNLLLQGDKTKIDNSSAGAGQGGNITLYVADKLSLESGTAISAASNSTGNAGNITLNATQMNLTQARVSTASEQGEGGNIVLNARSSLQLDRANITTAVNGGKGNGGNVIVGAPYQLRLQDSQIVANAQDGNGGVILIVTGSPILRAGNSTIEASSKSGINGEVKIDLPNVDTITLPVAFLDASALIKRQCAARANDELSSSFVVIGRGGLPNAPNDLQGYTPVTSETKPEANETEAEEE
ncbi:MAG: filamentous hemagglutinin N-terminal domain-containing protein [Thiotrichaceae bacterium]|nr:filamentous hemagglutinin N-terminal domain-containing protein [Thiotrichaceae bacterium]